MACQPRGGAGSAKKPAVASLSGSFPFGRGVTPQSSGSYQDYDSLLSPLSPSFGGSPVTDAIHAEYTEVSVNDGDDDEEEEETIYGSVPLMGETKMVIDDKDSTYVIMFPRQKDSHGDGAVNPKATRFAPKNAWMKIFRVKRDQVPPQLMRDRVPETEFQKLVRDKLLTIFRESGLKARATESVDKDEVFLRLSLDKHGPMIRMLAQRLQYNMPFRRELYTVKPKFGSYPSGLKLNDEGVEVHHYEAYNPHLDKHLGREFQLDTVFVPFSTMDEVRLIWMHLNSQVSLQALSDAKITSGDFPGAQYHVMKKLSCDWADWQNMFFLPGENYEEEVRSYFGEEITFFFRWLGMYARMLGVLSVAVIVFTLRDFPPLGVTMVGRDGVKIAFGVILVFWEALFQKLNKQGSARAVQAWGMEDFENTEASLPDYRPEEEGTEMLKLKKTFVQVIVVAYLIFFVTIVCLMQWWFFHMSQNKNGTKYMLIREFILGNQSTILSVLIKLFSFTWRKVASPIVHLGNYRTQTRLNDALITNLSIVKLFVSLFPFFHTAIVKNMTQTTRGDSLSAAAHKVYENMGSWPISKEHVGTKAGSGEYIPLSNLAFLNGHWYFDGEHYYIKGCHPIHCDYESSGFLGGSGIDEKTLNCKTNCLEEIQSSMSWLFVIQLASCIFWTLVPVVFTFWEVKKEMQKARKIDEVSGRANGDGTLKYSFIQMQAKCYRKAKYGFQEYGGSYVEDFMEMAISHALLACFGVVCPHMSIIAFVCILMQYRLLAYRLTNVTCRPMPRGSLGIGIWGDIFEFVSFLAVFFNVLLAVFSLLPMRGWPLWKQLLAFAVGEKALMLARDIFSSFIPDIPNDVTFLHDFNNEFRKTFFKRKFASSGDQVDYSGMDIGVHPKEGRRISRGDDLTASSGSEEDSPRGLRGSLRSLWNASPMAEFVAA